MGNKTVPIDGVLTPYFSVFNSHVNDAHKRAMKMLRLHFSEFYNEIKKQEKKGIMGIFDKHPTPSTAAYVALVTAFVNERANGS